MIGWIMFAYSVSVLAAYVLLSERWLELEDLWLRLIYAVFWPITALVWLARRPILKPMWFRIALPFAYLVLLLAILIGPFLDEPIDKRISGLWSRWLDRWPKPKRRLIRLFTMLAISYALLAIAPWVLGYRTVAIVYWSIAATTLVVMLTIWLIRKQVNSS